jgi:YedE family putative selenium metabolism protein
LNKNDTPKKERIARFLASPWGLAAAGAAIGVLASLLQYAGNPPNMGLCIAGFLRDIAGALGIHRDSAVQYLRPEIAGIVLGSALAAAAFREFKSRASPAAGAYFILGAFAMIGALVFQGCSLRALLRLSGGDLNALPGIAGFAAGVVVGVQFLKAGFAPGRIQPAAPILKWIVPAAAVGVLALAVFQPKFLDGGPVFSSVVGTGSMHAAVWISLGAGLIIGFLAQRSRLCAMGAVRDVHLMGDWSLMSGLIGLAAAAFVANLLLGQVHVGFADQPAVQGQHIWNFLGMLLVGWAAALAGGCPTRQLILAGEGQGDAAMFLIGMIAGGSAAHNLGMVDPCVTGPMPVTVHPAGMAAVILGLIVCLLLGLGMHPDRRGR